LLDGSCSAHRNTTLPPHLRIAPAIGDIKRHQVLVAGSSYETFLSTIAPLHFPGSAESARIAPRNRKDAWQLPRVGASGPSAHQGLAAGSADIRSSQQVIKTPDAVPSIPVAFDLYVMLTIITGAAMFGTEQIDE
jgi:hypothetical protein